jgi:DNA-3-methyladenine glycosylase
VSRQVPVSRQVLAADVLEVAPTLLGCLLTATTAEGEITVRLVEVEAYRGADDPAAHSYRGETARNAVMFGPPGHLYVYFVYGMHFCANISCLPSGDPAAVLLRAAEVTTGLAAAHRRKPTVTRDADLARGPARLTALLGLTREDNGVDVCDPASPVRLLTGDPVPAERLRTGPRVGVAAAATRPWRYWIDGEPAVSTYRPAVRRSRREKAPRGGAG